MAFEAQLLRDAGATGRTLPVALPGISGHRHLFLGTGRQAGDVVCMA